MNFDDVSLRPILVSIPDAVKVSGFSRSEVYRRLADGRLKGKKMRSRTLVLMESLRANIDSLADYRSPG